MPTGCTGGDSRAAGGKGERQMLLNLLLWGCAAVVFLIIEAATVGLATIWFAGGALAALVAAALGAAYWLQAVLFLAVSVALLACLRPFVRRFITPKKERTNADRVIGAEGVVTEPIDNLEATGAVKVGGVEWTARAVGDEPIPAGARVIIRSIDGVKLRVEKAPEPAEARIF